MLIFSLPTKATTKELRITLSLFVVVVCHICLTIPQVSNLLYSVYNSVVKVVEFHNEVEGEQKKVDKRFTSYHKND